MAVAEDVVQETFLRIQLLKFAIRRSDLDRLKGEINAVELDPDRRRALDEDLESARQRQDELRESIEVLRTMMECSQKEVGLDEKHFHFSHGK